MSSTPARIEEATTELKVAGTLDDVWEGEMVGVKVAGLEVLLVNMDGDIKAYENRCPHQAWALDQGDFDGERIVCSRHLWEFDAATGKGINPDDCALRALTCKVDDEGNVWVGGSGPSP